MESTFSDRASDCTNQHTPYLRPLPDGALAGCCLFPLPFMLARGTAALWPESAAIPSKQEEHTALRWKQETKNKPTRVRRHDAAGRGGYDRRF
ncbi:Hypothetical predicted protein [Scomber scombrus]|uniref:Uncharacterized protein n=1 Tax=Scomber scombrus TaxID=13677 RepID=A0AAV1MYR3_SCOSC